MKNLKVVVIAVIAIVGLGMFNACQKEDVVQKKDLSMKSLKSSDFVKFIIVTEEEKQFLEDPVLTDEFDRLDFIEQAEMQPGCFFVVHINADGLLQKTRLCSDTPHKDWYERLHEYREIAQDSPTFDLKNPEIPPVQYGSIIVKNKDSVMILIALLEREGYDYVLVYDSKTKYYTICWNDKK